MELTKFYSVHVWVAGESCMFKNDIRGNKEKSAVFLGFQIVEAFFRRMPRF